ncbi:MAG: hypothetical protein K2V38_18920, partial [Gemmataceae bacterium]|nr:hypothetical protein [Gemmataceae bacterium]
PDPREFADGVRALGLPAPEVSEDTHDTTDHTPSGWVRRWWESVAGVATRKQRIAVWELIGAEFFVVYETELAD